MLLAGIFAGVALLSATGAYLVTISLLNWLRQPQSYTTAFTLWTFLAHSAVGVVFLVPFLVFGGIHFATSRNRPNRVAVRLDAVETGNVFEVGKCCVRHIHDASVMSIYSHP